MESKKIKITDKRTIIKKYLLSYVFLFIAVLCLFLPGINIYKVFIFVISLIMSIMYFKLKKVSYNQEVIYFDNIPYSYNQILKVRKIEINLYFYLIFEINDKNKKRIFLVDPGGYSIIDVLFSIFSVKNKFQRLEVFMKLLEEKIK